MYIALPLNELCMIHAVQFTSDFTVNYSLGLQFTLFF